MDEPTLQYYAAHAAVADLIAAALQRYPQLAGRLQQAGLPDLGAPFGGRFDGVLCTAVLMHLARVWLPASVGAMRGVLLARGRALVSVPEARTRA